MKGKQIQSLQTWPLPADAPEWLRPEVQAKDFVTTLIARAEQELADHDQYSKPAETDELLAAVPGVAEKVPVIGIVSVHNANVILIEAAKEDLVTYPYHLYQTFDRLPERERETAYLAFDKIVNAAYEIGVGHLPLDVWDRIELANAALMRQARKKKRDAAGTEIARETAIRAASPNLKYNKRSITGVNERLTAKGHEKISDRTLKRELARLRKK